MTMTPSRPAVFHPELAPASVEVKFYSDWKNRPFLDWPARIAAVHTNAAEGEGSVDSASSWSERNTYLPGDYTIPHYQVDRKDRARKILPTYRRGIANATVLPGSRLWDSITAAQRAEINRHPVNVSRFSFAIETADTGTDDDLSISAFTDFQIATIAEILAFEHFVPGNNLALDVPSEWFGSGVGAHTSPFAYPFWTVQRGKTCPGAKKKAQMPEILGLARDIAAAWTTPTAPTQPQLPEDDMPIFLARSAENQYQLRRGDGNVATVLRTNEYSHLHVLFTQGAAPQYRNPVTGKVVTKVTDIPVLNETQLDLWIGYPAYELTLPDEG